MDFTSFFAPLLAPINGIFDAFSILLKVVMLIPAPLGILLSLALGFFIIRVVVGLL